MPIVREVIEHLTDKLLALNVPTNFLVHVEFAKQGLTSNRSFPSYAKDPDEWVTKRYGKCLKVLNDEASAPIGARLFEIECRFIALLKTVDHSVPVAPLWRKYSNLQRATQRRTPDQGERNYVVRSLGFDDVKQVPHSIEDFQKATTLAEKALIADVIAEDFGEAMREIAQHFNYKRKKFGRGASRTYSLIYAVLALAPVFETNNTFGKVAGVTLAVHGSGHEGLFLEFVQEFVRVVDAGTIGLRPTDGFNERVRKIAQKRAADTELIGLLDQPIVDAEVMLDFMERSDALKA